MNDVQVIFAVACCPLVWRGHLSYSEAMEKVDVFVSGGGLAGLVTAAVFGRAGFSVIVAGPAPPSTAEDDLRSTAYLRPAQALIARAGLWSALEDFATPLETLRIVDSTDWPPVVRDTCDFQSGETSDAPFGWNLPNARTRTALREALGSMPGVTLVDASFERLTKRAAEARITLTDGTRISARLAIAADGRGSPLREAAGIGTQTRRYGQKALAFAVTHGAPHGNISTEIYNQGGALTFVPTGDHEGRPCSTVVWMNGGARTAELLAMDDPGFEAELETRAAGALSGLRLATPRQSWPVVTRWAKALTAQRVAIVAEAAHVMPPIGAQGLNTSLLDVASLVDLAEATPNDLGSDTMLDAYARARKTDVGVRLAAIDAFNRVCMSGAAPVQSLRLAGLRAVHGLAPIRTAVMRAGLGA